MFVDVLEQMRTLCNDMQTYLTIIASSLISSIIGALVGALVSRAKTVKKASESA